jgi:predicted nucleic acid-binding protein
VAVKFLLDTNAVLYLLGGRLAASLPIGHYHVSVISEMELLSYPKLTADAEKEIQSFLGTVTVVDLLPDVKTAAIKLRRLHALKLPDAIVAASALVCGATLFTNDAQLLRAKAVPGMPLELKG